MESEVNMTEKSKIIDNIIQKIPDVTIIVGRREQRIEIVVSA